MCGRYELKDGEFVRQHHIKENTGYSFKPNYNVAPTQTMPVITKGEDGLNIQEMKWGIKRQIGPEVTKEIINTRANKALGRFWGKTVRQFRCLVPANGFYEWNVKDGTKTPFLIFPKDHENFTFAGIYNPDQNTYSIMTTDPNKEMEKIHNRMPVILSPDLEESWLGVEDEDELEQLLMPLKDGSLDMYEVSRAVNSPKNNNASLLERV